MNKKKSDINNKVLMIAAVSLFLVTAVFLVIYLKYKKDFNEKIEELNNGETIVAINEIDQLLSDDEFGGKYEESKAKEKIDITIERLQSENEAIYKMNIQYIMIFYVIVVVGIIIVYILIYNLMLKPFSKLENFAAEIAKGNLDIDLKYQRVNIFGEFTWAFDHMRREIKKAKKCEQEAVENNKTVIATLSHDIKTPIASIRAYSEALAENMDSTPERRNRYIDVITKKCDEVTKITNDMFIHSLHDLNKLIIKKEEVDIEKVITDTIVAMEGEKADIVIGNIIKKTLINVDAGRIAQVIENIINNARKYAEGKIYINTEQISNDDVNEYHISIRDEGNGIPPEDLPFIFEKFYRGHNCKNEPGAGLGLFIVKYIMEQMDGKVELINSENGLEVKLLFII